MGTTKKAGIKKPYTIKLQGCDSSTIVVMELTAEEKALIDRLATASDQKSTYSCMPVLTVEEGTAFRCHECGCIERGTPDKCYECDAQLCDSCLEVHFCG